MKQTYYFIGINGIGMSGLAKMLASQGHTVRGSDISPSLSADHFNQWGISVFHDHHKDQIQHKDWIIVFSNVIQPDNAERQRATQLGCRQIRRGDLLNDIIRRFKYKIGVVGAHGKTTTTAILVQMFNPFLSPSYFIGGHVPNMPHANLTQGHWFISELDESDGSFLSTVPTHAVITNIEHEHVDYYHSHTEFESAFWSFAHNTVCGGGTCAINLDDPGSVHLLNQFSDTSSFITYSIESDGSTIRATNIAYKPDGTSFTVIVNQTNHYNVTLPLFGRHNVYNALSAIAILYQTPMPIEDGLKNLSSIQPVNRRLEMKYKSDTIMLYDDYAHHPTEVASTLSGMRQTFATNRIITIFQPHRYSRLTRMFDSFCESFSESNKTIILPVFSVGEPSDGEKSSLELAEQLTENGHDALYLNNNDDLIRMLSQELRSHDIIVLMGAGDVTKLSGQLIPIIQCVE